ncbi:MAG: SulP family inorganic anion transporter, partial [Oscillospiraceae bacterium]
MLRRYISDLKIEFKDYNKKKLGQDFMAGMTVAAVALPLALAFGVSSGADAAAGLITAIISGFVITIFAGASFQISGPTGTMTAILFAVAATYGILFKCGKLVGYIPAPVILGFTSGIAVIIASGQIDNFFGTTSSGNNTLSRIISYFNLGFDIYYPAVIVGLLVIIIMTFYPKKLNSIIPSSLAAIIIATIVASLLPFEFAIVGDIPKTLLPENRLMLSSMNLQIIKELAFPALGVAALGMIESLLCGSAASRMKKENFDPDRELLSQGVGNIIIPFFGGVPATAALARTSVSIKSGGQTRLAGIFHGVGLLICMFLLGDVIAKIPLAGLAGVLMVTSFRMNEWVSIKKIFRKKFYSAISKYLITLIVTVAFDLTTAIIVGVILSIFSFAIRSAKISINCEHVDVNRMNIDDKTSIVIKENHANTLVVYITGSVFFANCEQLSSSVIPHLQDCSRILFSMRGVPLIDTSGIQAFEDLFIDAKI